MNIFDEYPPKELYDRIVVKWPEVAKEINVVFAYGDGVYNPSGRHMESYMVVHEQTHLDQQLLLSSPSLWWDMYIADSNFRLIQELQAYRAEYKEFCRVYKDKNQRNDFLNFQSLTLSSPFYGNMISRDDARKKIKA